jgi:hypothetical protein
MEDRTMTRRNPIWPLYAFVRIIDIFRRWSISAAKEQKYRQSRRRSTDAQYGRRRSDVTSPRWAGSFHLHILPVILLVALFVVLDWLVRGMMVR